MPPLPRGRPTGPETAGRGRPCGACARAGRGLGPHRKQSGPGPARPRAQGLGGGQHLEGRRASGGRAGLWLRGHSGWLCGERCTGSCEQRPRGSHRRQRRTRQGPPVRERRRGSAPARRCTVSAARLPAPRARSPLGTASRQVIPEPSVPRGSQCPVVAQAGSAVPAAPAEQSGPGGPGAGGWEEWRADRRAARHRD